MRGRMPPVSTWPGAVCLASARFTVSGRPLPLMLLVPLQWVGSCRCAVVRGARTRLGPKVCLVGGDMRLARRTAMVRAMLSRASAGDVRSTMVTPLGPMWSMSCVEPAVLCRARSPWPGRLGRARRARVGGVEHVAGAEPHGVRAGEVKVERGNGPVDGND